MTILIARGALVTCPAIFLHAVHQATRMLEVGRACHRRSFRPPVLELVHALTCAPGTLPTANVRYRTNVFFDFVTRAITLSSISTFWETRYRSLRV